MDRTWVYEILHEFLDHSRLYHCFCEFLQIFILKLIKRIFFCSGFSVFIVDRREWKLKGPSVVANASGPSTLEGNIKMARNAYRRQCSDVCHPIYLQCPSSVSCVLADILNHGRSILRGKVLQVLGHGWGTSKHLNRKWSMAMLESKLLVG